MYRSVQYALSKRANASHGIAQAVKEHAEACRSYYSNCPERLAFCKAFNERKLRVMNEDAELALARKCHNAIHVARGVGIDAVGLGVAEVAAQVHESRDAQTVAKEQQLMSNEAAPVSLPSTPPNRKRLFEEVLKNGGDNPFRSYAAGPSSSQH
ncbi:hypothetical protein HDU85_000323 [Gaertneriomyces sp. JEL0708]|nr:hypothetical protein HDU85_000323 [Gaertneriomyces sp. JEL0708]